MSQSPEEELDLLIDSLNKEQKPQLNLDSETLELLPVLRAVKSIRPQADPGKNLGNKIYAAIKKPNRPFWMFIPTAALITGFLLFTVLTTWSDKNNLVYAMEKAVNNLANYHGVLEMRAKNQAGEDWLIRKVELWSVGDKYATQQADGTLTVNNGQRKWQVRPQSSEVHLLPLLPDPTRQGFDLRDQAKRAKGYPHSVVGQETIAGRETSKLQISPPGGQPYYLWIDQETDLPIQLQTAVQNALQTTYTFISFEPNTNIQQTIFDYKPPKNYSIIERDPGQQVSTVSEASAISHLTPLLPKDSPDRIFSFQSKIILDYGDTTIVQTPAQASFEPGYMGALGKAAGGPLEVIGEKLRWQQQGVELMIEGPQGVALAQQIAVDLTLPDTSKNLVANAQIPVPVNMSIVKADQQQVDGGHSPWQLNPLNVALTFVNLKLSPEGIIGEPKVPEAAFKLISNNGTEAVVKVTGSPVSYVYLKRLVRQDETGIWSVVGYDPR